MAGGSGGILCDESEDLKRGSRTQVPHSGYVSATPAIAAKSRHSTILKKDEQVCFAPPPAKGEDGRGYSWRWLC